MTFPARHPRASGSVDALDGWLDELQGEVESIQTFASPGIELRFWAALRSALFWSRPCHPWASSVTHRIGGLLASPVEPDVILSAAASALATTALSGDFECGDRIALATARLVDSPQASPSEAAWWLDRAAYLRFLETPYESLTLPRIPSRSCTR